MEPDRSFLVKSIYDEKLELLLCFVSVLVARHRTSSVPWPTCAVCCAFDVSVCQTDKTEGVLIDRIDSVRSSGSVILNLNFY